MKLRYIKYRERAQQRGGNLHILFLKEIGLLSISPWFWLAMSLSWRQWVDTTYACMHSLNHQRREQALCLSNSFSSHMRVLPEPVLSTILNINSILCFAATNSLLKCTQKRQQRFQNVTRVKPPPPSFLPFISNSKLKVQ